MEETKQSTECCPKFDPAPWDDKLFSWDNKKFIKDKVFALFCIPINFGMVIRRMIGKIQKADVNAPDWMCLADHTSKWNIDLYVAVEREVPGAENVTLSGKFLSKVYEGPFKDVGKWSENFNDYAKQKGFETEKLYVWYTTCPKCAKKYGKNYVVLVGRVR